MQEELKEKEVLAMYDVQKIQDYIFRTNRIKEIKGASVLIENIISEGLEKVICQLGLNRVKCRTDWENDDTAAYFKPDSEIQMQVIFIGGGNAFVLFRKGSLCEQINRSLAKYVLEHTYSLQLSAAVVEKTDNFAKDYENINNRMSEIKEMMPQCKPMGAFPFMAADTVTGFPLVKESNYDGYVCEESWLKIQHYEKAENEEDLLDHLVKEKGDNSFLAMVHIDGNDMGNRITNIIGKYQDYENAVKEMRKVSIQIRDSFQEAFQTTCQFIDEMTEEIKPGYRGNLYRKLILAGDDITFICNAMIAIEAVKLFQQSVSEKLMYWEEGYDEAENQKRYGLSCCAGIAFFRSHFPFRSAYEVAEACCREAKERAKEEEHRYEGKEDGTIGSYLDFQICSHIKTMDLKDHRKKNYTFADRTGKMIYRPYYVSGKASTAQMADLNERNSKYDIDQIFFENLKYFQNHDGSKTNSKNKMIMLRNAYAFGKNEVEKKETFLKSRQIRFPETEWETWYDALEMLDLCIMKKEDRS